MSKSKKNHAKKVAAARSKQQRARIAAPNVKRPANASDSDNTASEILTNAPDAPQNAQSAADANLPGGSGASAAQPHEVKAPRAGQRVWEVDFVRGLMILFVVWDHFMWDVAFSSSAPYKTALFRWLYVLSGKYYSGALRNVTHDVFVTMFVLTSGISCSFSRNNGKRALKMGIFALLLTAVTYVVSSLINQNLTIYFNVIHVIAICVAVYAFADWVAGKCRANWSKNLYGAVMFAVVMTALVLGACAKHMNRNWLEVLFSHSSAVESFCNTLSDNTGDYLSLLPDFGWFFVGAYLGKFLYKDKRTLFPSVDPKYVSPVTFCGRHSLWVYFISQIFMYAMFYLLHVLFNVM